MKCPYCSSEENKVVDKRESSSGSTRRRRECLDCRRRFTTYEKVEGVFLTVIKKDRRKEPYDRLKLLSGMQKACEKRPVCSELMARMADEIESGLLKAGTTEIESRQIGVIVMNRLKKLDKIAYIRFASVYHEFEDVNSFAKEVEKLVDA